MVRNVRIKRLIKNTISPVLSIINKLIPKNDKIVLLYSANKGIEYNLLPLREYLLSNGYQKKYQIICGIESLKYADRKDIHFAGRAESVLWFFIAGHVFYTTGQIPIKPSQYQIVIHLDHGTTAIKTGNLLSNINNGNDFFFTYYLAPSDLYIPVIKKEFLCGDNNIKINGEPVLDIFFKKSKEYPLPKSCKLGLWAPTFRQSDYLGYSDSSQEELLPMFNKSEYEQLNKVLKRNEIYLFVKLHPLQNLNKYSKFRYSNLELLTDEEFKSRGFELYRFMKQMNFLIADYSSVYLEFLLLNRPIGFVIPDIEEYSVKRGFIFENVTNYMPGHIIKRKEELFAFFNDIHNEIDIYQSCRETVCNQVHKYKDKNNCKRCLELSGIANGD